MHRALAVIFLLLLISIRSTHADPSTAQATASGQTNAGSVQTVPPLVTQIKKSVVFIELKCKQEKRSVLERGTGFLVGIPAPELGPGKTFDYLVTNRHVAFCWDRIGHPLEIESIAVRANSKSGAAVEIPAGINGNIRWYVPQDQSIDLAVTPFAAPDSLDALNIPITMFATKDLLTSKGVAEGAKILFSGFFYQFPGIHKVQPIVREGILAMIPDEPLITTTGKLGTLYLGDVHIFSGNSGSPVFVDLSSSLNYITLPNLAFLGVVSGLYLEDQQFNVKVALMAEGIQHANSGIAMIVPADQVRDLIENDPTLRKQRETTLSSAHH